MQIHMPANILVLIIAEENDTKKSCICLHAYLIFIDKETGLGFLISYFILYFYFILFCIILFYFILFCIIFLIKLEILAKV